MIGRPPCRNASALLAALRDHMVEERLNHQAMAKILGISVSTLSRGLRTGRVSNEVRIRLLHHFPALGVTAPIGGQPHSPQSQGENIGQILHLLHQADSLLEDIRNRVVGLEDVTQAKS